MMPQPESPNRPHRERERDPQFKTGPNRLHERGGEGKGARIRCLTGRWEVSRSETGLRMTVVRSDTKCAALLLRDGRYPIDPPYGLTPTRSAAAKFGRRSSAPGASGAALGWVGEPEKAEPASAGVASWGDEPIWTRSVVGLDWIFGSLLFFTVTSWRCPRRLAGSDAGSSRPCAGEAGSVGEGVAEVILRGPPSQ